MDLDEMQAAWQGLDAKLDLIALRVAAGNPAVNALARLRRTLLGGICLNLIAIVEIASFTAADAQTSAVLIAGTVFDAFMIAVTAAVAAQAVFLVRIDYAQPVFLIASAVARLQALRARAIMWTLFAAPLMWVPLMVLIVAAAGGPPAVAALNGSWLAANALFGIGALGAGIAFARDAGRAGSRSPFARVLDSLSGREVRAAAAHLARLRAYAAERG